MRIRLSGNVVLGLAAAAGWVTAGGALAAPPSEALPDVIQRQQTPAPEPVRPGLPGTAAQELGIAEPPPLLREGAFVSAARGRAVKGNSGRMFFIFDKDAQGRTMPPMVLQQNQHLASLERLSARAEPGTRLLVTGMVSIYNNRNFLLLTSSPLLEQAAGNGAHPETTESPAPVPANTPTSIDLMPTPDAGTAPAAAAPAADAGVDEPRHDQPAAAEPTVEQIIADLERAVGTRRVIDPARKTVVSPGGESADQGGTLKPEGYIASRRGRIGRLADGSPAFILDSGPGDPAEGPMVLLPCMNLNAMEAIAERAGEGLTFMVGGQVFVYAGRNYLLPRTYLVNRASDVVIPNQ